METTRERAGGAARAAASYRCDYCSDVGFVYVTDDATHVQFGQAVRCKECGAPADELARSERNRLRLEEMDGLKPMERELRFADLQRNGAGWTQAVEALTAGLAQHRGMVTLTGQTGRGKTALLQATVNAARAAGISACYRPCEEMIEELSVSMRAGEGIPEAWELIREAKVVCLDEVAKFARNDWSMAKFFLLLDDRYRERDRRLTVLSGTSLKMLPADFQKRMVGGHAAHFGLRGRDMRQAHSAELRRDGGENGRRRELSW